MKAANPDRFGFALLTGCAVSAAGGMAGGGGDGRGCAGACLDSQSGAYLLAARDDDIGIRNYRCFTGCLSPTETQSTPNTQRTATRSLFRCVLVKSVEWLRKFCVLRVLCVFGGR